MGLLRWLWKHVVPDEQVLRLESDPEAPSNVWFKGVDGNYTLIDSEDLPEAIAAEQSDAASYHSLGYEGVIWTLDVEGVRKIIEIALETQDEDLALVTVVANTGWMGDELG